MTRCPVCHSPMHETLQDFRYQLDSGEEILIEEVPTAICERCGEFVVDDEVIAAVEAMLADLDEAPADRGPAAAARGDAPASSIRAGDADPD